MKALQASASANVAAAVDDAFALLADLDSYPRWYPSGVRSAEILERGDDGLPTHARATLHLAHGPLVKDFKLNLKVTTHRPSAVRLARIPHGPSDHEELSVSWRISEGGPTGTRIEVAFDANLSVPVFLPVGGVADSLARGFVQAAAGALR